jgi:cytoskeletal protein CcmA (bactofilin family)
VAQFYSGVDSLDVRIGYYGAVEGVIVAERVAVEGRMYGPIVAAQIHLGANAVVEGDLSSDNITMQKGALFSGRVWPAQPALVEQPGNQAAPQFSDPQEDHSLPKTLEPLAIAESKPIDPAEQKGP